MNEFYYDILNINKKRYDRLDDIERIVNNCIKNMDLIENSEGMCKVASNNISIDLNVANITNYIINTLDLGSEYEHYFIVAMYKTTDLNYVLIDPTFGQFVMNKNRALITFNRWPSDILNDTTEGKALLDDLLNKKMCLLNQEKFNSYLISLEVQKYILLNNFFSFIVKLDANADIREKGYFKQ